MKRTITNIGLIFWVFIFKHKAQNFESELKNQVGISNTNIAILQETENHLDIFSPILSPV